MKKIILKLCSVLLLFILISAGCKEDDIFELHIGDKNAVIVHEVNGVEFKFCLLDEMGQPATVFNEGENFSFLFAIKNNKEEGLPFFDYGFLRLKDFFAVSSKEEYYGKPYLYDLTRDSNLDTYPILKWLQADSISTFKDTWINNSYDRLDMEGKSMFSLNSTLGKGRYHTGFTYNFKFGFQEKTPVYESGKLIFKINFEIK